MYCLGAQENQDRIQETHPQLGYNEALTHFLIQPRLQEQVGPELILWMRVFVDEELAFSRLLLAPEPLLEQLFSSPEEV